MIHLIPDKSQAVKELKKERGISTPFSCRNDEIFWHDSEGNIIPNPTNITDEQISEKLTQLQSEYDAQDYARKRVAEYPSVEELVVALYDSDDKAAVDEKRAAVKLKYPKP
jgi:hypothetical protein